LNKLPKSNPYSKTEEQKFDIFSLGIILYELVLMEYDDTDIMKNECVKIKNSPMKNKLIQQIPKMLSGKWTERPDSKALLSICSEILLQFDKIPVCFDK